MKYIYPKFSNREIFGLRFGGAGLGNLLFIWARAYILAQKINAKMIWPTWPSFKLGTWIRNEKDKRFYGDLFCNNAKHISGIRKYWILSTKRKIKDIVLFEKNVDEDTVIIYDEFNMKFEELLDYHTEIYNLITSNLKGKGQKALSFKASDAINVHVRLGDFAADAKGLREGKNNVRISLDWYCSMVEKIRDIVGDIPVNVFSDGFDEELAELLSLPNVKRVTFGNSIADIIALSKAPIIIASGSSFSMWARFLGCCSSISYPKQMKERTLVGKEGFEIELAQDEDINQEVRKKITEIYS